MYLIKLIRLIFGSIIKCVFCLDCREVESFGRSVWCSGNEGVLECRASGYDECQPSKVFGFKGCTLDACRGKNDEGVQETSEGTKIVAKCCKRSVKDYHIYYRS